MKKNKKQQITPGARTKNESLKEATAMAPIPALFPSEKGFTLLEILIAISILSLITAIIASSLHIGILSWERGEGATERYQQIRILTDEMVQQLKSLYPYKFQKAGNTKPHLIFYGEEHSLGFTTTLVQGSKGERGGGLMFVYYDLDNERGLIKREKIVFTGDISIKDLGDPIELDPEVSELRFEYYEKNKRDPQSGRWVNSWDGKSKNQLPKAIRVTLGFPRKGKAGSSNASLEEITFTVPILIEPKPDPFSVNPTLLQPNLTGPNANPLLVTPPQSNITGPNANPLLVGPPNSPLEFEGQEK
ncbi:MAG TPA: type II secretion system protein GspJ [Candidatus Limnocylindrales bacterium]|nr:type II secretion system protein GspJ [Candidatus Limnocylindrales bacterium]